MSYPVLALQNESVSEASTKLHFELATARVRAESFLRVDFLGTEKDRVRLRGAVMRVLRERKRSGKLLFFISSEDFLSAKPEAEFIRNKYPAMWEDPSFADTESGSILVKL